MKSSGIIYYHAWHSGPSQPRKKGHVSKTAPKHSRWTAMIGIGMIALALGGMVGPLTPRIRMEVNFAMRQIQNSIQPGFFSQIVETKPGVTSESKTIPALFNPLKQADGSIIEPVDRNFSLIIPKIGVNAAVLPNINPSKPSQYGEALQRGVAHSSLSFLPNQNGTVYLFSHSTNYDWFVNDLNAVFYLLKNLETDDTIVISYNTMLYSYKITSKEVVKPTAVEYLLPQPGKKRLILQTCWPPGSVAERLLIFADLIQEQTEEI